ncbi:MAG TPA: M20/M25/M40 family metallo-hydrolase [Solirubrobacteraceae bacterium]|nr:M20/M25/M40 family metallo-hydrolase [Solirubrobacteraceae bacterium]
MRPASEAERARLNETFAELCRISSPFGSERVIADDVTARLRAMGLDVEEDDAAGPAQAGAGNLLARITPRASVAGQAEGERWILLCAHLDTVEQTAPIDPVVVDGGWENANDGILGADNKAGVAVILEVARRATVEGTPVGIEILFTVAEENGLLGAAHFDASRLRSEFGYVFDHATPIGEVVTASPTYYRVGAEFHGRAAHAGIRPEEGRSAILAAALAIAAMPAGRIDAETTANVGSVTGGVGSTNVVAERARLLAEARSIDPEKAETTVARMIDAITDGAATAECDVDITTKRLFSGYRQRPSSPAVVAAEGALRACGYEPRRIATGGGSDANALELAGLPCVNLANGTERNHEPTERVSVAALEGMLDVVLALLDESAALPVPEPSATL